MRYRKLLIVLPILLALSASGAYAWWGGSGSGNAQASLGTLNAPTNALAKAGNDSLTSGPSPVTISWSAPSGGVAPTGYKVLRTSGTTQSVASCGVVTTTTCTDASVPDGTYTYVVRSLYGSSWTADSVASNSLQVVNDTTAPTVTLTVPANNSASTNNRPTFAGAAGTATGDQSAVTVRIYSGPTTAGTLVQTLNATASAGAWSVAPTTALSDGTYTVRASQSDAAGNTGTSSASTFIVDTTAPSGGYTFPAAGAMYNGAAWTSGCATAGFCGSATDATSGVATVQLQIKQVSSNNAWDGSTFRTGNRMVNATVSAGAWSYAFSAASFPADGQYQVSGTITDNVGSTFTLAARTFSIDTGAPAVTLAAPANGARTSSTKPTFSGAAGTATGDLASITVKVYSGATTGGALVQTLNTNAAGASWSIAPTTALADGTYTAQAGQSDSAGNTSTSVPSTFTIDTAPPAVTITVPAGGSTTASQAPSISGTAGTATGDLAAITVKVYTGSGTAGPLAQTLSATASGGTWSATPTSNLAAGTYTVQASQSDSAGNSGTSGAVTFAINLTAPTIDGKPVAKSANTNPSFSFSHGVYSKFQCKLDAAAAAACNTGSVSYAALAGGAHTITVTALDTQNNATSAATYSWTIDTGAPAIGSKPANPSATANPIFAFTQASYTNLQCSLDGAAFGACTSATSQSYTGLGEGSHTVGIKALDGDGVSTQTASYSWTQRTTAPTIAGKPSDPSANKTPSFGFSETGYSSFQCSINGGSFSACSSGSAITSQADGSRTFAVRAVDGNSVATSSAAYAWTINTVGPSVTPVAGISAGGTYAATSEAFNFSHLSYSSFQCYLDAPATFVGCANGKTFSGLADGLHTVTSSALDSDNAATGNGTFSWTVKHAAPTLTLKPVSQTNSTTATFNFNETPYTLFQCQLDGAGFAPCNSGAQTYSSLSGGPAATGVSHTVDIHAVDALSASTADQTYSWTVDTVAPTGVTATSCAASGSSGNRQLGSSSGAAGNASTDSTAVALKIYSGIGVGGTVFQSGLSGTRSGATWTFSGSSNKLTTGSTYTLQATQSDAAGNVTVGATVCTFTA
jgi:large repetitive protein